MKLCLCKVPLHKKRPDLAFDNSRFVTHASVLHGAVFFSEAEFCVNLASGTLVSKQNSEHFMMGVSVNVGFNSPAIRARAPA